MENMDKGWLTVPKWGLIVRRKTPQITQDLSAQFVCPSPKVLDFNEKRLHWASVVRGLGATSSWQLLLPATARNKVRAGSKTTLTSFWFFDHLPTPPCWQFLPYKRWQKVNIFGLPTPSSCQRSLWTTPKAKVYISLHAYAAVSTGL